MFGNFANIRAVTCDFQQCGIFTSEDSDEPVQPPFKLRNSKLCSVSSLTLIEFLNDKQRLWSDCTYVQADLRLCWSHIPHCWKCHVTTQILKAREFCKEFEKASGTNKIWPKCWEVLQTYVVKTLYSEVYDTVSLFNLWHVISNNVAFWQV